MRRIAVITGTRAEYGLLYWIIKEIHFDLNLELQLVVTGSHLSNDFGFTVKEIEKDGFSVSERVEMLLSSDTEASIVTSMGLAMIGFAKAYERLNPDVLIVLGDRFEILSAVAAAVPFRIPVAHIHGGESTEGAMDELFRHGITKMSHIHFPATELYAKRIRQMGESPDRIFTFGAPGLDSITRFPLLEKDKLLKGLDLPSKKKLGIITYHPVTLELKNSGAKDINVIIECIEAFSDIYWIFTAPNADTGNSEIINSINNYTNKNRDKACFVTSLGQLKYLSLMKHAVLMLGNSSSGILEAASFKLPVVNIGTRQDGRIKPRNVIDVPSCMKTEILNSIKEALSTSFRNSLKDLENPYGNGQASEKIVDVIRSISILNLNKHFCDHSF